MKEYKIAETTIKERMLFTLIIASVIILSMIATFTLGELATGVNIKDVILINSIIVPAMGIAVFVGLKIGKTRLRNARLVLEEDFLVYFNPPQAVHKIDYKNIKEVKLTRSKNLIIKVSFLKKITVVYLFENLEDALMNIQLKMNRYQQ